MKIMKKLLYLEILTHKEHKIQEKLMRGVLQKKLFEKKSFLECSSPRYVVKILEIFF